MIKSISGGRPYEITVEGVYLNILCANPVIYLYPEMDSLCSVKVNIDGDYLHVPRTWRKRMAELEITPTPDSVLRVFMAAKPLDAPVDIEPQEFAPFERVGFTVVEWGGSIIE